MICFDPIACDPEIRLQKNLSLPHTHRCDTCANEDWNYAQCGVCNHDGFCDVLGPKVRSREGDSSALSVCYKCGTSGTYPNKWEKTGWEKCKKKAQALGIAKRAGKAIAKQARR
jgi:hypothetical protein